MAPVHFFDRLGLLTRRDHTLGTIMERLAAAYGDRRLVEQPGEPDLVLTYRQAAKRVSRWAGRLAGEIEPGDRVVVAAPNGYEFLLLCLAVSRAGGVAVPVNDHMRPDEVEHVIADSGAVLTIRAASEVDGGQPLAEAVPAEPGDVAALLYTSGTTGLPKGAQLTHRALVGQLARSAVWPSGVRRDEAVAALPLAHIMGFMAMLGLACAGIPVYLMPRFRPTDVLDAIESRRATIFIGVPAMYRMMLEAGAEDRDLRSIRLWGSGADAMPDDLAHRFKQLGATVTLPLVNVSLGQALFAEGYGMVELGGGVAAKISLPYLDLVGDDYLGFALPGYQLKVMDDAGEEVAPGTTGELWVKGPGLLKGYHGAPDKTDEVLTPDGWLRTGDLARRGPFGMVAFAGRQKDVILHGGYTIYAVEVETLLEQHPAVAEAVVVGLPDERKGEVPAAVVRVADGESLTERQLVRWAEQRLASYKVPRRVVTVDELPRTGTHKVQKRQLVSLFDPT